MFILKDKPFKQYYCGIPVIIYEFHASEFIYYYLYGTSVALLLGGRKIHASTVYFAWKGKMNVNKLFSLFILQNKVIVM